MAYVPNETIPDLGVSTSRWLAPLSLAAGFGFAVPLMASFESLGRGSLLVGIVVGLVLGRVLKGGRLAVAGGLCLGVVTWAYARSALVAPTPGEGTFGLDVLLPRIGITFLVALVCVAMPIGGLRAHRASTSSALVRLLGLSGAGALAGFVMTFGALAVTPGDASFDLPLPGGWTAVTRPPARWCDDPAFGRDYTAIHGGTEVPACSVTGDSAISPDPIIGVTVVGAETAEPTGQYCYRAADAWGRPRSTLYDGDSVDSLEVTLPVGDAYLEVRAPDLTGYLVYGYGIARTRQVGMFTERLCYLLAISTPPDGPIGEAQARSIAESFRFR